MYVRTKENSCQRSRYSGGYSGPAIQWRTSVLTIIRKLLFVIPSQLPSTIAVKLHVYSGTAIAVSAVSALVSRYSGDYCGLYSGATIVVPRYAVVYYTDDPYGSGDAVDD